MLNISALASHALPFPHHDAVRARSRRAHARPRLSPFLDQCRALVQGEGHHEEGTAREGPTVARVERTSGTRARGLSAREAWAGERERSDPRVGGELLCYTCSAPRPRRDRPRSGRAPAEQEEMQ